MTSVPLHHVWEYTDVDRAFWQEHLEGWMPEEIIDAHTHVVNPARRAKPVTEEQRKQMWVAEVSRPMDPEAAARCDGIVFPGRKATRVVMGHPNLAYDIEGMNADTSRFCVEHGWHGLVVSPPSWSAEKVERELDRPGIIGLKPYYQLLGYDPATRDKHIEADILDYLPRHHLEIVNERKGWVTLHVSKADRLPHPNNIRDIKDIRRSYPDVTLVVAHLGRCYTLAHAQEGLPPLADDPGLYFDNSAVLNPDVHRFALDTIGPERILYGTDNPVFYMRGRRQWEGRKYINRTNHPFHFNKQREAPEIEARYTLYMYEALKAFKDQCDALGLGRDAIEAVMRGNAERLLGKVAKAKQERGGVSP